MSRRLAAGLLALGACAAGHPAPSLVPEPVPGEIEWTVLLMGDGGSPDERDDPTFGALAAAARQAPDRTTVVFLGDNVYPDGLPPDGTPERAAAERVLEIHLAALQRSGTRGYFLLGNHDWRTHEGDPDGRATARRQEAWLETRADGRARVMPAGACPGPVVEDVGGLRLVFLDTEWWLQDRAKWAPAAPCEPGDSAGVVRALESAIAGAGDRPVLALGHHPLASGGRHGGHFNWRHHLFPLTDLEPWAWVPLPIVGSIYPVLRMNGISDQDFSGARNRALRGAFTEAFARHPPALYASGHEHTLQVIGGAHPPLLLVSGTGSTDHGSYVGWTDSTRYASVASGWIRVDLLAGGRLRVGVIEVDRAGRPRETWSDLVR
ncbi:MAG TPA: metallophosphoesterase [Gemmatimonadales bacterium]|nr:metallophosphoesterase [Gemmatimonadales bacterium]